MKNQTNLDGFTKSDLGVKSLNKCTKVEASEVGVFATTLDNVCNGTFITFKPLDYPADAQVYQKEYYDRSEKKYVCDRWNASSNEKHCKGSKVVYINFNY
jgi:hypothetical protein